MHIVTSRAKMSDSNITERTARDLMGALQRVLDVLPTAIPAMGGAITPAGPRPTPVIGHQNSRISPTAGPAHSAAVSCVAGTSRVACCPQTPHIRQAKNRR